MLHGGGIEARADPFEPYMAISCFQPERKPRCQSGVFAELLTVIGPSTPELKESIDTEMSSPSGTKSFWELSAADKIAPRKGIARGRLWPRACCSWREELSEEI